MGCQPSHERSQVKASVASPVPVAHHGLTGPEKGRFRVKDLGRIGFGFRRRGGKRGKITISKTNKKMETVGFGV